MAVKAAVEEVRRREGPTTPRVAAVKAAILEAAVEAAVVEAAAVKADAAVVGVDAVVREAATVTGDEIRAVKAVKAARTGTAKVVPRAAAVEEAVIETTTKTAAPMGTAAVIKGSRSSTRRMTLGFTWREVEAHTCTTSLNTSPRCSTARKRVKCPNANKFSPRSSSKWSIILAWKTCARIYSCGRRWIRWRVGFRCPSSPALIAFA